MPEHDEGFVNGRDQRCKLNEENWYDWREVSRDTNRGVNTLLQETKSLSPKVDSMHGTLADLKDETVKLLKTTVAVLAVGFLAEIVVALVHDRPVDVKTPYGSIEQHEQHQTLR